LCKKKALQKGTLFSRGNKYYCFGFVEAAGAGFAVELVDLAAFGLVPGAGVALVAESDFAFGAGFAL